jgi:prepilin-type N-terminal cleavage/methylation domain-containing protein
MHTLMATFNSIISGTIAGDGFPQFRSNEKQVKSGFWKLRIERHNLISRIERLVTPNRLPTKDRIAKTAQAGFTIVEMIVVVTIIGLLAAVAVGAHTKVANDAKVTRYKALISTLTAAKSAWLANPTTTAGDVQTFNADPEAHFAMIAPYIRVNGAQPTDEQNLLSPSGMPKRTSITSLDSSDSTTTGVRIRLGTVDDSSFGGQNQDQAPTVTGYGL